ncbi:MAG: PRC-barrel domain containing protein [Acidobacteria bacterium]|nr:MAG: PRC-barrel domain containing protein [Acidobacteriota bacterium]
MLRSMKHLDGFAIGATDGDIGTVREFYFDDVSYTVRYAVVDTGNWLGERKVLLSPIAFRAMDWEHKRITAALTKDQVEKSPDIDTQKPVSRQHEIAYYGYYGYTPYWAGSYLWGAFPYPYPAAGPVLSAEELERERRWNWESKDWQDPHLRSSLAVTGYHIQATDGDIGHVEDFLVDDRSWAIRYMIVDTTNWWPGKKVLVSPAWIERVDWAEAKVHVDVGREQIRTSPEYDPARPIERAYETRLHGHYAKPGYWNK